MRTLDFGGKSTFTFDALRAQIPSRVAVTDWLLAIRAVARTEVPVTVAVTFVAV
jgi:hypothetical protein